MTISVDFGDEHYLHASNEVIRTIFKSALAILEGPLSNRLQELDAGLPNSMAAGYIDLSVYLKDDFEAITQLSSAFHSVALAVIRGEIGVGMPNEMRVGLIYKAMVLWDRLRRLNAKTDF